MTSTSKQEKAEKKKAFLSFKTSNHQLFFLYLQCAAGLDEYMKQQSSKAEGILENMIKKEIAKLLRIKAKFSLQQQQKGIFLLLYYIPSMIYRIASKAIYREARERVAFVLHHRALQICASLNFRPEKVVPSRIGFPSDIKKANLRKLIFLTCCKKLFLILILWMADS